MKKVILGIAVSSAMVLATNVCAGPYVVASLGKSQIESDFEIDGFPDVYQSAKDTDTFLSIGFGYMVDKNFSVEVAYNHFGEANDSIISDGINTLYLETDISSFSVAAQGSVFFGDALSIVARVGAERWDGGFDVNMNGIDVDDGDDSGVDLFYGVGISYALSKRLSLAARYDIHKMDASDTLSVSDVKVDFDVDIKVFSLGAQLTF
ncbi:hypothetical protein A9Q81_25945 [Gammaproteobacteria bacterium 42_54_T18]|nr:hypothetical protein A9Q81_25945 [Gammaproteobacteria bacterium 42_54_T18]